MTFIDIPCFLNGFFDFMDSPIWRAWPFNAGYGEQILPSIARLVFISLIMSGILLFLRILFGPKGYFRDEELDREAENERFQERTTLEKKFANNEISETEFKMRMKSLKD